MERPGPLVVLIERNPWLMVIGSDSPTFALYSDGLVIFRNADHKYFSVRLDEQQKNALLTEIAPGSILGLRKHYETVFATDQPTNELSVWVNGKQKRVDVYGVLRADGHGPDPGESSVFLDKPPPAYLHAFNAIVNFAPEAAPWLPDFIEILIVPAGDSREETLPWPEDWPPLANSQRQKNGNLRRVFLPAAEFPKLQRLMKEREQGLAFESDGRKWGIIAYRFPFPNENAWMR